MPDSLPIAFILIGTSAPLLAIGVTPSCAGLPCRQARWKAGQIHASPVPLLGGAAIYAAFIRPAFWRPRLCQQTIGILRARQLMIVMGVLDDRRGLGSYVKAAGPVAGRYAARLPGVQIQLFGGWIDILITLLWVGITNAQPAR